MGHYDSCREETKVSSYEELARRVVEVRGGGRVERCHGVPHRGSYANSSHSWGVAMLMHHLWPEDFPRLALACLTHDSPERVVGDIPAPPLRVIPGLRDSIAGLETKISHNFDLPNENDLDQEDHRKLKACDHLELWIWSMEELAIGNAFAQEVIEALEEAWKTRPLPERAELLRQELKNRRRGVLPEPAYVILERLK